jgi:hypothetical protein
MIIGQRYTFYVNSGNNSKHDVKKIRANIKDIYYHNQIINDWGNIYTKKTTTLSLHCADTEKSKNTTVSIPLDMIIHIENLETILSPNRINASWATSTRDLRIPSDVLLLIDNYL